MTVYKKPFRCPKCGGSLRLIVKETGYFWYNIDPETGETSEPAALEDSKDMEERVPETLECNDCQEVFNFTFTDKLDITSFNDDIF